MFHQSVSFGKNVYIGHGVVIDNDSRIGAHSRIFHNSVIRNNVILGPYVTIGHLVVVEAFAEIGEETTIQSQCHITRDAKIGRKVFFGPMAMCINETRIASHGRKIPQKLRGPVIGDGARIGSGVLIVPGVKIGQESFIAAGSVVTKDIPPFQYWRGTPAKFVGMIPEEEKILWDV